MTGADAFLERVRVRHSKADVFARLVTHIQENRKTQYTRLQRVELKETPQGKINFDPNIQQVERGVGKVELINYLESVRFEIEPNLVNEPLTV